MVCVCAYSEVFPSYIIFIQPLSMRHSHSHHHNQHINQDNYEENPTDPMLAPSTSSVCMSHSTDGCTKSPSSTMPSPTLSSPSSSLTFTMEGHEKNEQAQLLGKQKKKPSHPNNLANVNQCCSTHSATNNTAPKMSAATVHFADSVSSSSTKQSPLSSQFEHSAHNHDTQRSVHVIAL